MKANPSPPLARYYLRLGSLLLLGLLVLAPSATARTVTDPLGRTVTFAENPRRIVALAPNITEIVFALGQEARLVGVTRYSDYPPAAQALPKVGSYVQLDVERIAALRPDLCIGIKDGNPLTAIEQLQRLGIPVFAVDPRNLTTVIDTITIVGDLLDARETAQSVTVAMRHRMATVRRQISTTTSRPRVFFQLAATPMVSAGGGSFVHDLIVMAGGVNVAEGPRPYPRFSREQVIALAPDVIVISSMERAGLFEEIKAAWMQWPTIPAVAHNAVFIAPTNLFDRPSPRLVDGLELLARFIHPELFGGPPP